MCVGNSRLTHTAQGRLASTVLRNVHESIHSFPFLPLKLLEQIKALEQAISQQSGEREELIGQLGKITEDHTSAYENTESMVGKIQVRGIVR